MISGNPDPRLTLSMYQTPADAIQQIRNYLRGA
jgi:hypothetical protein